MRHYYGKGSPFHTAHRRARAARWQARLARLENHQHTNVASFFLVPAATLALVAILVWILP